MSKGFIKIGALIEDTILEIKKNSEKYALKNKKYENEFKPKKNKPRGYKNRFSGKFVCGVC